MGHIDYYKTVINTLRSSQFSFTTIHAAQEELPIFYAISDVFVLMSRDEGDPLVLLEAMSSGLPCITSGVGSFRMQQGVEMFIATTRDEFKKQIEALLHDSYLRKKVGEAARLSVLKHDWSEITKMYMALYEEAINSA
ncbi:MAG: glycosyltransferase family 4 protein [Nitrososphaerota archaeon]